jgi:hypothetical protein
MSNTYRIRTEVGIDQNVKINLEQDYEFLEILSLKIQQANDYTRSCADYGVVVGRVIANGGLGIPNVRVSVFIPITEADTQDPVISTLYPYTQISDINEDGYRYNLLPYTQSYEGHTPTGTFPSETDVLTDQTVIQVYDTYYKYVVKTNESGDFMIFGVPIGDYVLFMDMDVSDIGEFSLSPQDLIRAGKTTLEQLDGIKFKSSTNLSELPQIITLAKNIQVEPFWGDSEICNISITRKDFDLRKEFGFNITPTATFMGSIFSNNDEDAINRSKRDNSGDSKGCKTGKKLGKLCNATVGPGQILSIRQTVGLDENGSPVLEQFNLENNGKVIDENGTWLIELPMNMDYVTTNEFGERVISRDPNIGIPTTSKYRFKISWDQPRGFEVGVKRANYLVPNIKEHGWTTSDVDPAKYTSSQNNVPNNLTSFLAVKKSYAFSLDWNDYYDVDAAINCEDTFYKFEYNKIYTISQLIDYYRKGANRQRFVGIKQITDPTCESEVNKFPATDAFRDNNFQIIIVNFFLTILGLLIVPLTIALHILVPIFYFVQWLMCNFIKGVINVINILIGFLQKLGFSTKKLDRVDCPNINVLTKGLALSNLSYPDCESCDCNQTDQDEYSDSSTSNWTAVNVVSDIAQLSDVSIYNVDNLGLADDDQKNKVSNIIAGNQEVSPGLKVPVSLPDGWENINDWRSKDLTLAERLNLFNTKSKYFNNDVAAFNFGDGVKGLNQIKVTIRPDLTANNGKFHYDNVIAIMLNPGALDNYVPGTILSFVNPTLSNDPNPLVTYTGTTQTGTSGVTINKSQLTINYANPASDTAPELTTVYAVTQTDQQRFINFPTDIEYFQVIQGYKVSDILNNSNLNTSFNVSNINNRHGFFWEYIFNSSKVFRGSDTSNPIILNPTQQITNYQEYVVLFLVRGVDPNSQRMRASYDLSRMFSRPYGSVVVTGDYKLNHPIRNRQVNSGSSLRLPNHAAITNNSVTSNGQRVFYPNFSVSATTFIGYQTGNLKYYSSLDIDTINSGYLIDNSLRNTDLTTGEINYNLAYFYLTAPNSRKNKLVNNGNSYRGYLENEYVDGGGYQFYDNTAQYWAPTYGVLTTNVSSSSYLVVRTDRLPTSSNVESYGNNAYPLMQSRNFYIQIFNEDGSSAPNPASSSNQTLYNPTEDKEDSPDDVQIITATTAAYSCEGMTAMDCLTTVDGEFTLLPSSGECNTNVRNKLVVTQGCYRLVTAPIVSLFGRNNDIKLATEWLSRFRITNAACQGAFAHSFFNSWVNGTLFMYPYKNDRFFDGNNNPYFAYCTDTIFQYSGSTTKRSFYYRSSPYNDTTNKFIGRETDYNRGSNTKNLMSPTTILDLGPKFSWSSQVNLGPQYEGYIANRLQSTSFSSVDDLLFLFLSSRLMNSTFFGKAFGLGAGSIEAFFNRQEKVNGDYAQMLQTNSTFGIKPFDFDAYQDSGDNPIYVDNNVFGVFYDSETETRDLISPKRLVRLQTPSQIFADYIPTNSQEVPFYYWTLDLEDGVIFGSEDNTWVTNSTTFYSKKYQELDRTNAPYFQPSPNNYEDRKGYIYQKDNNGNYFVRVIPGSNNSNIIQGNPWYFYFGLKKGKTALDRFFSLYVTGEIDND